VSRHKHGDRNRSLTVYEAEDGWVCFKCHVGCTRAEILTALGLHWRDLRIPAIREWTPPAPVVARFKAGGPCVKSKRGALVAIYRYTDERGELLAEKIRYEGKVFSWRRPHAGGWVYTVPKDYRPLYRLHEVVKFKTVFLVEGEKDADRMALICKGKAAATTAPDGAKSWRPELASWFKGKLVYVIPDTDEPGRKYGQRAAKDILLFAQKVFIIYLPEGKDVSEYLDKHPPADLRKLIKQAAVRVS
jgi:hypothetical protein